jgi:hypothetical protein
MAALGATLWMTGCRNLDFGDNPMKEVPKTDPQLTAFPSHLTNGATE